MVIYSIIYFLLNIFLYLFDAGLVSMYVSISNNGTMELLRISKNLIILQMVQSDWLRNPPFYSSIDIE